VNAPARKALFLALQVALGAAVAWLAWRALAPEISGLRGAWGGLRVRALPLVGSAVLVLTAYVILIETWRRVVSAWGSAIPFGSASRIWFISNLGKYVPGKVWAIAAMGVMAQRAGVAPAVAVGSSLYINAIHVLSGFALCLMLAPGSLPIPPVAAIALGIACLAVVLTPSVLSTSLAWAARRIGRDITLPPLRYATVATTFAMCTVAWVCYGVAFKLLAAGTIGDAAGATSSYIALFTGSYLIGYLAFFAPGGAIVRESAMVAQAHRLALMSAPDAALLAVISRVWLTVFELLPGLILLVLSPKPSMSPSNETRTL
jgi:hypothetical protein